MKNNNSKSYIVIICGILLVSIGVFFLFTADRKDLKEKEEKEEDVGVWVQDGDTLTRGNKVLTIGDIYDYDETNGGKITNVTDVEWKVLGINEKGNLLLVSSDNVSKVTLGNEENLEVSQQDYLTGIDKLNFVAENYGHGKGAISARSINVQDIDKITGYDRSKKGNNSLLDYGTQVTYSNLNDINPKYDSNFEEKGILSLEHEKFVWYNEDIKKWCSNEKIEDCGDTASVTNTWYSYSTQPVEDDPLLEYDSAKYKMLFSDIEEIDNAYWVATPFTFTSKSYLAYGYLAVKREEVNYNYLVFSNGISRSAELGVRVVVTIE